jgi:hypothetical protein
MSQTFIREPDDPRRLSRERCSCNGGREFRQRGEIEE